MFSNIPAGDNIPEKINVIIEISMSANPVKYEVDKNTGVICVDRFLSVAMHYPCNYGFIPQTLGGDQDPLDVLVLSSYPIQAGAMVRSRPIGVLILEDEAGMDEKIIAVPLPKIDTYFQHINDLEDLSPGLLKKISHFFTHYKDLEEGKWVKVMGFEGVDRAKELIKEAHVRSKTLS
jgi:inorganic pyrophosphatase